MDLSFLKLHSTFDKAKEELLKDSQFVYNGGVCLSPNEIYLQSSNSSVDIAFDESYTVEIIDCAENVLLDITEKVFITEFQDSNGVYQINFEIVKINKDFYFEVVYLKFTHTASNAVFYSNSILITDELCNKTFRADYKNYEIPEYYQSIRLVGYFNSPEAVDDEKVYTEFNGNIRTSRVIQSYKYNYKIDRIDTNNFFKIRNLLNSDILYIDNKRASKTKNIELGERFGKSNLFEGDFSVQLNDSDIYLERLQIAPIFGYTSLIPLGAYTPTSIPTTGVANFNYNIIDNDIFVYLYNYIDDTLLFTISTLVTDNVFSFTMPSLVDGEYYILLETITSTDGQMTSITDKEEWKFSIGTADFLAGDFNSDDFYTN